MSTNANKRNATSVCHILCEIIRCVSNSISTIGINFRHVHEHVILIDEVHFLLVFSFKVLKCNG
jgi:hypothetical protein